MTFRLIFIGLAVFVLSCHAVESGNETKRIKPFASKFEDSVKLAIKKKFETFSYLNSDSTEYFTYLNGGRIYVLDLASNTVQDSIIVSLDSVATGKYGAIRSFCFSGKDSLFVLFDQAIFFWISKKLVKVIPINRLDTVRYRTFRFQDLEDVPIYYDKKAKAVAGEVYCSDCWITEPAYYRQKLIGSVSVESGNLKLFNISYPEEYVRNYYGYDNKPYGQSIDSITLMSFPCDANIYELNRNSNTVTQFAARSIYQTDDPRPLIPLSDSGSVEQKMRHMTVEPYYSEILFDKVRKLYYRFFREAIPLKNKDGTYNDFFHKRLVLMVFNSQFQEIGEYELPKYYNSYGSFVGKSGLYVLDISINPLDKKFTLFHLITFK